MNGLLSQYPESGIAAPSNCPLLWEGRGKINRIGFAFSSPALVCDDPNQPCVYKPPTYSTSGGANTCASGNGGTGAMYAIRDGSGQNVSLFIHSGGANFVYADGHVKWHKLGSGNRLYDPYSRYDSSGNPGGYWYDGCFSCLFRPDWDGTSKTCFGY